MNWINLTEETQLNNIKVLSADKPQVIFKHSTRCSISSMAKSRLDKAATTSDIDFYYLDLIAHRNLSSKIAAEFNVTHESPQVLVIKNGNCIYDESHNGISFEEILEQTAQ